MSLFGKKQPVESRPMLPKLPELPKLPGYDNEPMTPPSYSQEEPMIKEFPTIPEEYTKEDTETIHQLPSFPTSETGQQFTRNSIKSAITGNNYEPEAEELPTTDYKDLTISPPTTKLPQEEPSKIKEIKEIEGQPMIDYEVERPKSNEPIFIRIDKFEESLKIFDGVKGRLGEIENMLSEVKELKEKEQIELTAWEESIQKLKHQIEKVDSDIFSKIE